MKTLFPILLTFLFVLSCSDNLIEEVVETYDNGNKRVVLYYRTIDNDTVWVERNDYYENGNFSMKSYGKDEKLDSLFSYYENGNIKMKNIFIEDIHQTVIYYENGQKQLESFMKNGKPYGQIRYSMNGDVEFEIDKDNNVKFIKSPDTLN